MYQLLAAVLVGSLLTISAPACHGSVPAQDPQIEVKVVNADRVYRPSNLTSGQTIKRTKPAVVDSRQVFDATPEYKKIKQRKLDPSSAEAMLLRKKASDRFKAALRLCASSGNYDLIAEKGAVTVSNGALTDVTQEVIGFLQ